MFLQEWNIFPSSALAPVVENCNNNNESFLCEYPLLDLTLKSNVPILMGMNSGEGGVLAARELYILYVLCLNTLFVRAVTLFVL